MEMSFEPENPGQSLEPLDDIDEEDIAPNYSDLLRSTEARYGWIISACVPRCIDILLTIFL